MMMCAFEHSSYRPIHSLRAEGCIGLALACVAVLSGCERPGAPASETLLEVSELKVFQSDSLLHDVRDVYIDAGGTIWVLDAYPPFVHHLDSAGRVTTSFGVRGPGPKELQQPWNFVVPNPAGDQVEIWDAAGRRVVRFDTAGTYLGQTHLEVNSGPVMMAFRSESLGEPINVLRVPGGYAADIYDGQVSRTSDLWKGKVLFLGTDGEPNRPVMPFGSPADLEAQGGTMQVFAAAPLWTVCPNGTTQILNPRTGAIRVLAGDNAAVEEISVEVPPKPITEADIRRYVAMRVERSARDEGFDTTTAEARNAIRATFDDLKTQLPRDAPPVRLRCDAVNRIWIELFSTEWDARGYGGGWLVLDGDGQQYVKFPPRFHALSFGQQAIAGIAVGEYGEHYPAVVQYPTSLLR
jgi:hypothetical protein